MTNTKNHEKRKAEPILNRSLFFAVCSALFLAASVGVVCLLVWLIPRISALTGAAPFLAYTVIALSASAFLFGAMNAYGHFSGHGFGAVVKFGGSTALFVTMLGGGMVYDWYLRQNPTQFDVQVYLTDEQGEPVRLNGTLRLRKPDGLFPVSIDDGHATIALHGALRGQSLACEIEVPAWKPAERCNLAAAPGSFEIHMVRRPPPILDSFVLRGEIRDATNDKPLDQVAVSLPEYQMHIVTGEDGQYRFELRVDPGTRIRLRASKAGYRELIQDPSADQGHLDVFKMERTP